MILIRKLKEEYHTLFIKTFNIIEENDSQWYRDVAYGRMVTLLLIMQKYLGLLDDQKRGALLKKIEPITSGLWVRSLTWLILQ